MNLTVVLTISLSPLSTNMRLPTAEWLAIFMATGQLSSPSLRKTLIILFYDLYFADARLLPLSQSGRQVLPYCRTSV
jgi:hypothetical protein